MVPRRERTSENGAPAAAVDAVDEVVVDSRFAYEGNTRARRGARMYCLFCLAMLALSAGYSWVWESGVAPELIAVRLVAAAAIGAVFLALRGRRGAELSRPLLVVAMLVMSLEINALALPAAWHQDFQYERLPHVILGTAVLATWIPVWSAVGSLVVVIPFVLSAAMSGLAGSAVAAHLARLTIAAIVSAGAATVRERGRWRELWQAHTLTETRRRADSEIRRLQEHSRLEAQLRQQQEYLAHLLRVGSMGEIATQIAHEVNQPLCAMVNYANGLSTHLRERGADPDLIEITNRIAAEGLRAGEVIRRIRAFTRRSDGDRERAAINDLVRTAVRLVEPEATRRGIDIEQQLAPSLPPVDVDCVQIEQVLVNLLRNAIEAIGASTPRAHELVVTSAVHGDVIEVSVTDTGVGVAPELLERIFDAFFTTKSDGVGMGLSISRSIVESHAGRLHARPNAGGGMTFAFTLPVHRDAPDVEAEGASAAD
jgi:signal transduction histidine kinase